MTAMTTYEVRIEDTGETYRCASGESLLHGMARLGKRGIPLGCQGGGCGVCRIQVVTGEIRAKAMSRAHVTAADEAERCLLACRVFPESDVAVRVVGKLNKNICRPGDGSFTTSSKESQSWQ